MASYIETSSTKLDWAMPFQRTGAFPLDRSTIFSSYSDALKYAKANPDDPDSRSLYGTSYIGQVIAVFENDTVSLYQICVSTDVSGRGLTTVGVHLDGDNKSIVINNDTIKLKGFENATAGQQCRVVNTGTVESPVLGLEWFTPDYSTVEGLSAAVGALQTDMTSAKSDITTLQTGKANKADVYTKSEVDGKISGALHYQGTYASFAALTAAVSAGIVKPVVGDVWNITAAGGVDASGTPIKAGDNVIYNGTGWDVSSGTTDLSAYYTKAQADALFEEKVDKVAGSRLLTTEEATKIAASTKTEESTTNGNIKIDGTETNVYTLPKASTTLIGGVKGSTAADKISVNADGTMGINTVSASKISGTVASAAQVAHTITIGTKIFNGSATVNIVADDIPLPDSVIKNTNYATALVGGVVKSSTAQDKVSVDSGGEMTVNNISASKVIGTVSAASKVTNALSIGTKTFDGSAPITIEAADIPLPSNVVLADKVATASVLGLVKSSTGLDKVTVAADGTMSVSGITGANVNGTVSSAENANKIGGLLPANIFVSESSILLTKVKAAAIADKLATSRTITLGGDVGGSGSFDGSANLSIEVTLDNSGVTAGTYAKVTVDAKGRVTNGAALIASDIPNITLSKITDSGALAGKDKVASTDLDTTLASTITDLTTNKHTHANKTVLDGISSTKINNWDNAASLIGTKADKATTLFGYGITNAYTKTEIDGKLAGAFHFKGSYDTFAALTAAVSGGTITPVIGDTHNIKTAGGVDAGGTPIKSGDNVAYNGTGWDSLAGTMDLSAYCTKTYVDGELLKKANQTEVSTISDKVDALENTVGNASSGLVKTVADHTTLLSSHTSQINTLNTTVGSASSGLVKDVADNEAAITKLNGDVTVTGSVRQIVAASATEINNTITNITKTGGTIDTKISAHNTNEAAHTTLFAAKQNKVLVKELTIATNAYTADASGAHGGDYYVDLAVTGLDTNKDYRVDITPVIASKSDLAAVISAQFVPMNTYSAGVLSLGCNLIPTAAIKLSCAFTEIVV